MEEEPSATLEASSAMEFSLDCSSINECSCSSHKDINDVTMPICFLVKEQAKAFIDLTDVKKRLNRVENVQDDVVSAIIDIRNYLSDSRSYSALSCAGSPSISHLNRTPTSFSSKQTPSSKLSTDVPSDGLVRSVVSSPRTVNLKGCESIYNNELAGGSGSTQERSPRHFDLGALESDKQDSGLDSDCREHHDPLSLNKASLASFNHDNDELLQLLDEIGHRSVILQKQLAVAEETTTLVDLNEMPALLTSHIHPEMTPLQSNCHLIEMAQPVVPGFAHNLSKHERWPENYPKLTEKKVPTTVSMRQDRFTLMSESELCESRKSAVHGIDSTVVSSILKETNVVDLQRLTLTYFVDNAVLKTKLREMERSFASKKLEGEKIENALKEEARLLMMENRELRIQLEEQRLESNSMKSRLSMLERVVQSVSNENQELNWQLGESLNLPPLTKRVSYPANVVRLNSSDGASKTNRRSSLPTSGEMNIHCVKSKFLSNASSFLNVTEEDPRESNQAVSSVAFGAPTHSSTPMLPFQKQKDFKSNGPCLPTDNSPANFHSVKKCLKFKTGRLSGDENCMPDSTELLPSDNKFPFNTILEKLKANSEYRLSKGVSVKACETPKCQVLSKSQVNLHGKESVCEQKSPQDFDVAHQRRKGRNIQQRIQNILDRIVAESEEAS